MTGYLTSYLDVMYSSNLFVVNDLLGHVQQVNKRNTLPRITTSNSITIHTVQEKMMADSILDRKADLAMFTCKNRILLYHFGIGLILIVLTLVDRTFFCDLFFATQIGCAYSLVSQITSSSLEPSDHI